MPALRSSLSTRAIILAATLPALVAASPLLAQEVAPSGSADNTGEQSGRGQEDLRGVPQPVFNFDVKPGNLRTVLDDISAQSGSKYRSQSGAIPDVQSPGTSGRMTLHEAVVRALSGTGIRVVDVRRGEIRLAAIDESGSDGEIVVTARRSAFKNNFSSAATRTDTPLRQVPATVNSVTTEVLATRNAFSLGEAMRNIPGAIFQGAASPNQVRFGPQSTGGVTFTDGLRNGSLNDNTATAMIDSIEVVKGPASLLSGTQVGGGLVNYVPKRANGISPPELSLGIGTGREILASADVGGAVPGVDNLYFRVIAFAQNADENPAGGNNPYQYVVSPMLGYRSDSTSIDLNFQYSKQRVTFARRDYLPVGGTEILSLRGLYNPDARAVVEYKQVGYNVEQALTSSADFTLKLRARGLYQDGEKQIAAGAVAAVNPVTGIFTVAGISQYAPEWTTSHAADLYAKFETGPLEHQFIVGGDFTKKQFSRATGVVVAALPITGLAPVAPIPFAGARSDEPSRQYGVFIQDQINWGPVHLLLGLRQSWFDSSTRQAGATRVTLVESKKLTPTVGAVFDVSKAISVYASYTQAFTPASASQTTISGDPLPPTLQTRYEAGIKTGFFDDRLDLNLSVFKVTTDNEARADIANPGFFVPGPGRKAKGFEISAVGSLSPTLKLSAGYTYTEGKLVNGDPLDQSPKNVANLWIVKTIPVGDTSSLDVGFGGNYFDKFFVGATASRFLFDREYLSVDGSIAYKVDNLRLNLTVSNLFDRRNYALSGALFQLERSPPRVVRLVLSTSF
jgi:TonB-dependent siderophore receptor